MDAGAGVLGAGAFVFSTVDVVSRRALVLAAAAGWEAGGCGVEDGVVACGVLAGMLAGAEGCCSFCSNTVAVRRW